MSRKSEGAVVEKKSHSRLPVRVIGERPPRRVAIVVSVKGHDEDGQKSGLVFKVHGKSLSHVLDAVTGALDGE